MGPALLSVMKYFNWTRIAILTQNEGVFTGVCIYAINKKIGNPITGAGPYVGLPLIFCMKRGKFLSWATQGAQLLWVPLLQNSVGDFPSPVDTQASLDYIKQAKVERR